MQGSIIKNSIISVLSVMCLVIIWKLGAVYFNQELILPSPGITVKQLWGIMHSDAFWPAVGATVGRGLIGFLISCLAGVVIGLAAGFSPPIFWLMQPWITVVKATPVMSVIILAIIWFQTDVVPVFVTFLMIFPIIYGNVVAGIKNVDHQLLEMASIYKVKFYRKIFELYIPSTLPYLLAGASTAMGITWKVIIASEILSQPELAIGTNLMVAKINLATAQVLAWTVVAIIISFLFEYFINVIDNRLKFWS